MKRPVFSVLLILILSVAAVVETAAQEPVTLRFLCFQDRNECDVYADLLSRFSEEHPDINVAVEVVAEAEIHQRLSAEEDAGAPPDLARVSDLDVLEGRYLNLRPLLMDAEAFAQSFQAPFLEAMRAGDAAALHGFPDTAPMVAPFVNVSLFEAAGVALPSAGSDWVKWLSALEEVKVKTGVEYSLAVDNKDHRLLGPAMSLGARYFDDEGALTLADDLGLRAFLAILQQLLEFGRTPADTLLGTGKSQEYFVRGETLMYICGSWKVEEVAAQVGDDFEWAIVANPSGPGGGTGVVKATAIVALAGTAHPEAVAQVLEYLSQPAVYAEFSARTLTIPAHLAVAESTIDYDADSETIAAALNAFASEVPKLQDQAIALDLHPLASVYYDASNTYLRGYFAGELTLDEALSRLQEAVAEAEDKMLAEG